MKYVILVSAVLVGAAQAEVLTLAQAEDAAVTTGFTARSQHFNERAKEWEKWNAVANYLPRISYSLTYLRLDEESVEAAALANRSMFEQFGAYARDIAINESRIDSLESSTYGFSTVPDTAYGIYAQGDVQGQTDADAARSPFAVHERSWTHEFTLNQPITNGGVEVVAIGIARHMKRAIEYEQDAVRQQAIYEARKAYFEALSTREFTAVTERTVEWTRGNLEKARVRHEQGVVPITDVLQWQADLAAGESDLLMARARERTALLVLHQAMGITIDKADTAIQLQPLQVYEAWYNQGPVAVSDSIGENPSLLAVREYTSAAKGSNRVAVTQMMPKLNAFLSYGWPAWDEFLPPEDSRSWSFGVTASVPLFSGFRNATNYRKTKYEHMKAVVDEQQLANQLAVNLDRIASFYRASYHKVAAAMRQRDLMQRQLEIMQQRYDSGLVNQSQLLEVELGARQAQLGYISALFDCLLLEAEYRMNVGNLEVAS